MFTSKLVLKNHLQLILIIVLQYYKTIYVYYLHKLHNTLKK